MNKYSRTAYSYAEGVHIIKHGRMRHKRQTKYTDYELVVLAFWLAGRPLKAIAKILGVSKRRIYQLLKRVKRKYRL